MADDLFLKARQAIFTQSRHIRCLQPCRRPLGKGDIGRANLYPVIIIRRSVRLEVRAAGRIDLAVGSNNGLIHIWPHLSTMGR